MYRKKAVNFINSISKRFLNKSSPMANSRFDYVRNYEKNDAILPNCWIVVRIDGKAFHKFTQKHDFNKPNDDNGKYDLKRNKYNATSENINSFHRFKPNELCGGAGYERIQ